MNASKEVALAANPFATAPVVAAPTGASGGALMSREAADVQTAMMIARSFPRDQRAAMDRILMSCTRETLAEEGLYEYARGGTTITGPSIRLAEEMARSWGNMRCGVVELSRFGGQSEVLTYAEDLETGFRDEKRFMVKHWRDKRGGGEVITEERDIYEHIANQGARRKRACILSIIPIDVQEAAVKQCEITLNTGSGSIEPERVRAMLEGFLVFGVTQEMIEKRIQRRLDSLTPALMINLRKIYASLKDGMSSPAQWFETVDAGTGEVKAATGEAPKTQSEAVTAKLRAAAPQPAAANVGLGAGTVNLSGSALVPPVTTAPPAQGKGANQPIGGAPVLEEDVVHNEAKRRLQAAGSADSLKALWKTIRSEYINSEIELPLSVEAIYQERREALEQGGEL